MRDSQAVNVVAGLVTVGALAAGLVAWRGGLPPRLNPKPHQAVGQIMAGQALGLLKAGGQITVIRRDTTAFENPATEAQLASFQKAIRKAHAALGSIRALQVDALRPVEVPPGDFLELIRSAPPGSVIVSFMGPPLLSEAQRRQLGEIKPAIVAFCSGSLRDRVDLRALFAQGLLHAAVVSRPHLAGGTPASLQQWFDQSYVAVTAANLDDLPAPADAPRNSLSP